MEAGEVPEEVEGGAEAEAAFDFDEGVMHDGAVGDALGVGAFEVEFGESPEEAASEVDMAEVIARRDEDSGFCGVGEAMQVAVGEIFCVFFEVTCDVEAFGVGDTGEAVGIPEEEAGGAEVIGVGEPVGGIGAVD